MPNNIDTNITQATKFNWFEQYNTIANASKILAPKDNYIYFYHLDKALIIPVYPDNINDAMSANFNTSSPLLRSAPLYSYASSGPRDVSFTFILHRDLMHSVNRSLYSDNPEEMVDYVDDLVKSLQASVVPKYNDSTKIINPPMVAVRIADEIFIKGVINGSVSLNYGLPLINFNNQKEINI